MLNAFESLITASAYLTLFECFELRATISRKWQYSFGIFFSEFEEPIEKLTFLNDRFMKYAAYDSGREYKLIVKIRWLVPPDALATLLPDVGQL